MSINYEKSFKKLVEQIKLETGWSVEQMRKSDETRKEPWLIARSNNKGSNLECEILAYGRSNFDRGQQSAYRSILELAELLEKGEFEFGDEENDEWDEDLDGKYEEEVMEDYLGQHPYH